MKSFLLAQEYKKADIAVITGKQAHHIRDVLRLKRGDTLQLFDGQGNLYQGRILATQPKQLKVEIEYVNKVLPKSTIKITLAQALPKKNKMDYIVEKATELGVSAIIPIQTERTIPKLDQLKQSARKLRWQRIAAEAAKQCGRLDIPQVKELSSWSEVLSALANYDFKLIACLSENTKGIKDILRTEKKGKKVAILIGPEGDFTKTEINKAQNAGFIPISLGSNVLKSDTAALACLSIINYELSQ